MNDSGGGRAPAEIMSTEQPNRKQVMHQLERNEREGSQRYLGLQKRMKTGCPKRVPRAVVNSPSFKTSKIQQQPLSDLIKLRG